MPELEILPVDIEALAQAARDSIEGALARVEVDPGAFWHAVGLLYSRGLPKPAEADPTVTNGHEALPALTAISQDCLALEG